MITYSTIAVNRYAPEGSGQINLYSNGNDGGSDLTIAQLSIAVSMHAAAAYESQSVLKMNRMANGSVLLSKAADCMQAIADNYGQWSQIKPYLQDELGITADLPDEIDTYEKRMAAIAAIKTKIDSLAQTQQEEMIDLQTLVNRRDVAYSTSSNIVRALGSSMNDNAINF